MQSTKTASITQTVFIAADELRALVSRAAKNFVGVVDGKDGVKLVSSDATIAEDGSAEVAIVYEQAEAAPAADVAPDQTAASVSAQPSSEAPAVDVPAAPIAPIVGLAFPGAVG